MCVCEASYFFSERQRLNLSRKLDLNSLVDDAISQLYNDRKIDEPTRDALIRSHYEPLKEAVNEGYGKTFAQLEYNTPNFEFLKQLQTNTAVFAAFKSHASIKAMSALLKDGTGNVRSKEDFKREALKVDATYRVSHLDVEYDTAVRSARMAANWQKYEARKKLYPNLKYLLSKAANPDKSHMAYVGIIRPIDDAFWAAHYPPNRWRCQCSVEPTDADPTDVPDKLPPVDPVFAFNPGKTGQVFNLENSDYIKSVPPKEQPALIRAAGKEVNREVAEVIPFQPMYKSRSGTAVAAHPMAFDNQDFQQNLSSARDLANSKLPVHKIDILPELKDKTFPLREKLLPDGKGKTNPDFRIDGKLVDAKVPTAEKAGSNSIQNRISDAHRQADGAVLILDRNFVSEDQLFEDIYAKLHHAAYKDFQLFVKYGKQWYDFQTDKFLQAYRERKKPR